MKRWIAMLLCLALLAGGSIQATAQTVIPPEITARGAVLMDADTGQVLYGKNQYDRMEPASLTKIMTALLALEQGEMSTAVTMPREGMDRMWESTTIGLQVGETLSREGMLYGMMLESGNDAANALAVSLAGSMSGFVEEMNREALELGLTGTHFANAHGLPDPRHYSTAYDLAQITREALKNPQFAQIAGTAAYTLREGHRTRRLSNTSGMVIPGAASYYSGAIATKTGWTDDAGYCLMTVARRDDRTLIAIVLDSTAITGDSHLLLNYGFGSFERTQLRIPTAASPLVEISDSLGNTAPAVTIYETEELSFLLPRGVSREEIVPQLPSPDYLAGADEPLTLELMAGSWPYSLYSLKLRLLEPESEEFVLEGDITKTLHGKSTAFLGAGAGVALLLLKAAKDKNSAAS